MDESRWTTSTVWLPIRHLVNRVLIITDRKPQVGRDPGFERRFASLMAAVAECGLDPEPVSLSASESRANRLRRSVVSSRQLRELGRASHAAIFMALNAPHVLLAAGTFGRHRNVLVDCCDSLLLTASFARREGDRLALAKSASSRVLLRTVAKKCSVSYITERDLDADASINSNREALVIPQAPPAGLSELPAFSGPPNRVVIPADLSAPHNALAFAWLIEGLRSGEIVPEIPIEVYGPSPPAANLPNSVRYVGWADDLADVYRGQTAVFAPNLAGAGLQNKLWEALHAGRPLLIGAPAAGAHGAMQGVLTFSDRDDLFRKFNDLMSYRGVIRHAEFRVRDSPASLRAWLNGRE